MEYYITTSADYWIAPNAVYITLNALGEANRIQGSVATGAVIMCFIEDIKAESAGGEAGNGDGLWYGANHEPKRWPLSLSPTYFNSDTRKYVYAAVPRRAATGNQAVIVFPSELLDIYGRAERTVPADSVSGNDGQEPAVTTYEQIGSEDYFYIYLHGIIGVPTQSGGVLQRQWEEDITDWGRLDTAQGRDEKQASADWYTYANNVVTFLKEIVMRPESSFANLYLNHKNLRDVATSAANAPVAVDADLAVATPGYVAKFYLSKVADDVAAGHITFQQGLQSVLAATFGTYSRTLAIAGSPSDTGASITPDGTGDFIDLIVRGMVRGNLTIEDLITAKDIIFKNELKGEGARKGFTDGTGIYMNAKEGLIETDGMNVRGFMRVMELIINRLQLMESDYSFTEGDTVDHIDYEDNGQTLVLTMHKDHDNDYTPFYEGDIIYAKINDLLPQGSAVPDGHTATKNGSYYTSWMRVKSVDLTHNQLRVALYPGKKPNGDPYVPGGTNFSPHGTAISDMSIADEMQVEYNTVPQGATAALGLTGYDTMLTVTRHGNVADSADPLIKQSQLGRQQAWVLSTTDKRLSFFWNVDEPIIHDENYALCLGILPDLANLPTTRDRSMPSLYVNTVFYDNRFEANYPPANVKVDRGQWVASPTATYTGETGSRTPDGTLSSSIAAILGWTGSSELTFTEGQTISEPYHCNSITRNTWLTYRLKPSYNKYTDADLYEKIRNVFGKDHETSRVWRYGKLWECLTEATTEEPSFGCQNWVLVSGDTAWSIEFVSSNGNMFYQGHVETTVTAHLFWGIDDVTAQVGASAFSWTRSTEAGKTAADTAWDNIAGHRGTNVLTLGNADMPTAWSRTNRAIFTCTAIVNDGDSQMVIQNQIVA